LPTYRARILHHVATSAAIPRRKPPSVIGAVEHEYVCHFCCLCQGFNFFAVDGIPTEAKIPGAMGPGDLQIGDIVFADLGQRRIVAATA
jgi:hypothetical protein